MALLDYTDLKLIAVVHNGRQEEELYNEMEAFKTWKPSRQWGERWSSVLRRKPIRYKRKVRSISWRTGRVREDASGMARLRSEAYERSGGMCECGRLACLARPTRLRRVNWSDGHLHHAVSRAHGGSDTLDNVRFITHTCHNEIHGIPQFRWIEI